jgi:hypothetical protein
MYWASTVPLEKWRKKQRVLRAEARKGAMTNENVSRISPAKAQRRKERRQEKNLSFSLRLCAFAGEILLTYREGS